MKHLTTYTQRRVNIYLFSVVIFCLLSSSNLWLQQTGSSNTVLRVMPRHVSGISEDQFIAYSTADTLAPTQVAAIKDGGSPQGDRNGHARPSGRGAI
jgi:hypothetical protein